MSGRKHRIILFQVFLAVSFVQSSSFADIDLTISSDPLVAEVPMGDSNSVPLCAIRGTDTDGLAFGVWLGSFDLKTNSCPKDLKEYWNKERNKKVKFGIAPLDGTKSDTFSFGAKKLRSNSDRASRFIAYPVTIAGRKHWEVVCAPEVFPVESTPPKKDWKFKLCLRESPLDPIKDEDIDKFIEQKSIKCPYPARCQERELPLLPVATYVSKITDPRNSTISHQAASAPTRAAVGGVNVNPPAQAPKK